ncbi:hypothetical protein R1sor_022114 [Riccia sorocarpa]|uniref:PASTA domain-containing protein n=1 Tax=Riccia sorocarpa TaxID=122646 RepID=A0ABD3GIY7_9MARC
MDSYCGLSGAGSYGGLARAGSFVGLDGVVLWTVWGRLRLRAPKDRIVLWTPGSWVVTWGRWLVLRRAVGRLDGRAPKDRHTCFFQYFPSSSVNSTVHEVRDTLSKMEGLGYQKKPPGAVPPGAAGTVQVIRTTGQPKKDVKLIF